MLDSRLCIGPEVLSLSGIPIPQLLLADSGYISSSYMITPFEHCRWQVVKQNSTKHAEKQDIWMK